VDWLETFQPAAYPPVHIILQPGLLLREKKGLPFLMANSPCLWKQYCLEEMKSRQGILAGFFRIK
jgi:hypothetical protein